MSLVRIQNLIATPTEWSTKNPILRKGEYGIAVEYIAGKISKGNIKVGDGFSTWNELPYITIDEYTFSELVSQDIGDFKKGDSLQGLPLEDIINGLVSAYVTPEFTSFVINDKTTINYEIGTDLLGSYLLEWTFNELGNVKTTGGIISSTDINAFTNLGNVDPTSLLYNLNSTPNYTYNLPESISVSVDAFNTKNVLIGKQTVDINWLGKIRYGVRATSSLTTTTQVTQLGNSFLGDKEDTARVYQFGAGYPFILIPSFIDISNIKFFDDDNGLEFSMDFQNVWDSSLPATISFNNGNTTFTYNILRGEFFYNSPVNIRIEYGS